MKMRFTISLLVCVMYCTRSYRKVWHIDFKKSQIDLKKSDLQSHPSRAFVQSKDIHDNVLIAHKILIYFSKIRNKQGLMAIKLDK